MQWTNNVNLGQSWDEFVIFELMQNIYIYAKTNFEILIPQFPWKAFITSC